MRLTEQEYARVESRAVAAGLTPASYLAEIGQAARTAQADAAQADAEHTTELVPEGRRLLVEEGRVFGVLERRALAAELMAVRRLLSGVATNLNQLAKVANSSGHVLPSQVGAVATAAQRYLERLAAVVATLDPRGPG